MTENNVNVPLLRKAVEWAEVEAAKPAIDCEWNQRGWVTLPWERAEQLLAGADEIPDAVEAHCGTAYCIAGYVANLSGFWSDKERAGAGVEWGVDGEHVSDFAQAKLGIDDAGASDLFYANNTIEQVRSIAETIAGERL